LKKIIVFSANVLLMIFVLLRAASVSVPKIHGMELLALLFIKKNIGISFHKLKKVAHSELS